MKKKCSFDKSSPSKFPSVASNLSNFILLQNSATLILLQTCFVRLNNNDEFRLQIHLQTNLKWVVSFFPKNSYF